MSILRWTNKSTVTNAMELTRLGHRASDETVRRRLRELGYSLQVNAKTIEGESPAERDEQYRYINRQVKQFLRRGEPVLSIDTKKKEKVGRFKNGGGKLGHKGEPKKGNMFRYPHLGPGTLYSILVLELTKN